VPFRLHASDGRVYDIRHPDQVMPLFSKVIIGVGGDVDVPDHAEHISMNYVLRLEELSQSRSEAS